MSSPNIIDRVKAISIRRARQRDSATLKGDTLPTKQEIKILDAVKRLGGSDGQIRALADLATALYGKSIPGMDRVIKLAGSSDFAQYDIVVPLENPNCHNYTLRVPYMLIGSQGGMDPTGWTGNNLPVPRTGSGFTAGHLRHATLKETEHFWASVGEVCAISENVKSRLCDFLENLDE